LNDVPTVDTAEARRVHDQLLANRPEGASHNEDICVFCVDKATEDPTASRNPPADGGPVAPDTNQIPDEHGGRDTSSMSDTMTKETHDALLSKAVADATSTTEKALEAKTTEAKELADKLEKAEADLAAAKSDNERLNGELDTAQAARTAAEEKVTTLETDIKAKDEAAVKAETASKRADQVRNLKLFTDEQVAEKASRWAELSDEDWTERLAEWAALKPASTEDDPSADAASAMSGTGDLTKEPASTDTAGAPKKPSARRAVLGLS
jgi:hypothetical protein